MEKVFVMWYIIEIGFVSVLINRFVMVRLKMKWVKGVWRFLNCDEFFMIVKYIKMLYGIVIIEKRNDIVVVKSDREVGVLILVYWFFFLWLNMFLNDIMRFFFFLWFFCYFIGLIDFFVFEVWYVLVEKENLIFCDSMYVFDKKGYIFYE